MHLPTNRRIKRRTLNLVVLVAALSSAGGLPPSYALGVAQDAVHSSTTSQDALDSAYVDPHAGPWTGFRQNAMHTGRSREPGPAHPWRAWTFDAAGTTYSSPAVGEDGTIYIGSADSIYAIGANGRRLWAVSIDGYAISSPAIGADGTIYVGSRDKKLYALQPLGGRSRWTFTAGDEIWSSPTIGADGTVYIGSFDGNLYALNPTTGVPRWVFPIGSKIISSPAVGADGTIYVGALDKNVYAIDRNGSGKWSFPTGGDVVSSPAIGSDGTIYVGSFDGNLYAIGPNGNPKWTAPFRTNDKIVSSPAIGADGTIYVGSLDGNLYAVRPDGRSRWAFLTDEQIMSSPAVDGQGVIYIGSFSGQFYAVNPDGLLRWSLVLPGRVWSSPAIGLGSTIYIASTFEESSTGQVYAIHSATFQVRFRSNPVEGVPQVVEGSTPSEFVPTSGQLFYRTGGEREYRAPVPLQIASAGFEADIPAEAVTLRGIQYYVVLTNGQTTATFPPIDPINRPASQTVRIGQSVMAGITIPEARYAMISVPFKLDNPSVGSVLEDDFGPYAPSRWRLLRWEGGAYREHPAIEASFTPGTAFFVTTRGESSFDLDEGEAVDLTMPYLVVLQPGWNQIANPFPFPVSLSSIQRDTRLVGDFAYWNGTEMCQEMSCVSVWKPWEGFFALNKSDGPVSISFRPIEAETSKAEPGTGQHLSFTSGSRLRLVARVRGSSRRDSQNWIGFHSALEGDGVSDLAEAPPFGADVNLSIMDGETRFAGRFRPLSADGAQWDLELSRTDEGAVRVEVTLIEEESLPAGFHTFVLDRDNNEIIQVDAGRFTVDMNRGLPVRRLSLIVGTDEFAKTALGDTPIRPQNFELEQNYPNPFNPETIIAYQLPQAGHVSLDIFDVVGRRVRTLLAGVQEARRHEAAWDGLNDAGDPVASGIYLYRIRYGASTQTKTMLLLR